MATVVISQLVSISLAIFRDQNVIRFLSYTSNFQGGIMQLHIYITLSHTLLLSATELQKRSKIKQSKLQRLYDPKRNLQFAGHKKNIEKEWKDVLFLDQ